MLKCFLKKRVDWDSAGLEETTRTAAKAATRKKPIVRYVSFWGLFMIFFLFFYFYFYLLLYFFLIYLAKFLWV